MYIGCKLNNLNFQSDLVKVEPPGRSRTNPTIKETNAIPHSASARRCSGAVVALNAT